MKKVYLILAATVGMTITSCTTNDLVGEMATTTPEVADGVIQFSSSKGALTRADLTGEDAAKALDYAFVVEGTKGASSVATTVVFDNYNVVYPRTLSESDTKGWEYEGLTKNANSSITGAQTIKYWDYSQAQYDFIAYSLGNGGATATAITPATAESSAYTIAGNTAKLKTVHIADLKTVLKANYDEAVTFSFRPLVSKVRVGLYETIPGYSVKAVQFYTAADDASPSPTSALYASSAVLPVQGTYTVYFPTVNDETPVSDKNKAHVSFAADGDQASYLQFGAITGNYTTKQNAEETTDNSIYLGRQSNERTWAGVAGDNYYTEVLPFETNGALTLKVDYTLVSIDGSREEITVHGATAVVPAIYTTWKPGYAYTYIFKISDNTNGRTDALTAVDGLRPITFDAVVVQSEEHQQETVTTVATPSITTYQATPAVNASANNEYKAGTVYAMVMDGGTLKNDLKGVVSPAKDAAKLYSLSGLANPTEADVMQALNMYKKIDGSVITGLNGLELTEETSNIDNEIADEDIPGPDGNLIPVEDGEASKLTVSAGTYAYVYTVEQGSTTTVKYSPATVTVGDDVKGYYTFSGGVYTEITVTTAAAAGTTYYLKYTETDQKYAVKVIKVVS